MAGARDAIASKNDKYEVHTVVYCGTLCVCSLLGRNSCSLLARKIRWRRKMFRFPLPFIQTSHLIHTRFVDIFNIYDKHIPFVHIDKQDQGKLHVKKNRTLYLIFQEKIKMLRIVKNFISTLKQVFVNKRFGMVPLYCMSPFPLSFFFFKNQDFSHLNSIKDSDDNCPRVINPKQCPLCLHHLGAFLRKFSCWNFRNTWKKNEPKDSESQI